MITLIVELTDEQAHALAQFYKRISWWTFREHAPNDTEANAARDALYALSKELAEAGYNPR